MAVPQQVSVLGYDDTPAASYWAPALSAVHIPWAEVTLNGINRLINVCYGTDHRVERDFPISIALRGTLARVGAASP